MPTDLVIAHLGLHLRGVPTAPSSADTFVRSLLEALEREFDVALHSSDALIVIPRLTLDLCVTVPEGTSTVDAVAHAMAAKLAQIAAIAPAVHASLDPAASSAPMTSPTARAHLLHEAAKTARAGRSEQAIVSLLAAGSVAGIDPRAQTTGAPETLIALALAATHPLAFLGRFRRKRFLPGLFAALDEATARALLDRVAAELLNEGRDAAPVDRFATPDTFPAEHGALVERPQALQVLAQARQESRASFRPSPADRQRAAARIAIAEARARAALGVASHDASPAARLTWIVAELARISPASILRSGALRAALLATLASLGVGVAAGTEAGARTDAEAVTDAEADTNAEADADAEAIAEIEADTWVRGALAATLDAFRNAWARPLAVPTAMRAEASTTARMIQPLDALARNLSASALASASAPGAIPVCSMAAPTTVPEAFAPPERDGHALLTAAVTAAHPIAALGRLARRRLLARLIEVLDANAARALVARIGDELLAAGPWPRRSVSIDAAVAELAAAEARALHAVRPEVGDAVIPQHLRVLLIIAELARLTPAAIAASVSLRAAVLAVIAALEIGEGSRVGMDTDAGTDTKEDAQTATLTATAADAVSATAADAVSATATDAASATATDAASATATDAASATAADAASATAADAASATATDAASATAADAASATAADAVSATAANTASATATGAASATAEDAVSATATDAASATAADAASATATDAASATATDAASATATDAASATATDAASATAADTASATAADTASATAADTATATDTLATSIDLFSDDLTLPTSAAGLAFLLRPLLDLGWPALLSVVHPEPSLALHALFRRVLSLTLGDPAADDPAAWVLAGLLDAPTPEELAVDARAFSAAECAALTRIWGAAAAPAATLDAACDAWARALLDEARLRLEGTTGAEDLARDVLALRGVLATSDTHVEVRLPFSRNYEALLRAGLSLDLDAVPWLDGRPLRFVFFHPTGQE
ncbi:hypothetical protein BE21_55515 [Sorangium cellulosum]|uniref:Uncharacterized protein n=1 Tax=Sorangium cellulosum TaxID=56 RepID=A0A150TBA2_SORCE|nr:hypothetical protein BE21_55515 [Sorangium cellulosum]